MSPAALNLGMSDFSGAIVGGVSERKLRPTWLHRADNLLGRPHRACRIRPGTRDISTDILSDQPHSLMGYYAAGGNKLFVGAAALIFEAQAAAYPVQTLPSGHPAGSDIWTHTNLDGVLIVAQRGGAKVPLFYDGGWKELLLPKPGSAPTFNADSVGGAVDVGDHYYRVRWRYAKGSSLTSPVSAKRTVAAPNQTVNLTGLDPGVPRADYLGWTLERSKVNGDATGPFWWVADGTGNTYADARADASLGYRADEGVHGEPPHFDGVCAFTGRLFGWSGSGLYASNAIGDLEATGIANYDADNLFQIAKDDGDTIQVCLVVGEQLLILKKRSVHVLSGVDPDSYTLTSVVYADPSRGSEAGCAGPRAATVIGGSAYFWGDGGLFKFDGRTVSPFAWEQIGHYIDTLNTAQLDQLTMVNHAGDYWLGWYPIGSDSYAKEMLVYDARFRQMWHFTGWRARDVIELRGGLFNNASMVFCDPLNRASFGAIAGGASITGAGVPGATIIQFVVAAGDTSLSMSNPATATAKNVTLTIAGAATAHCNTINGSPVVTISEYHCWAGFDSFKDEKTASGAGGNPVSFLLETPFLDGGSPDAWKAADRLAVYAEGDVIGASAVLTPDPADAAVTLQLLLAGSGNDWAADVGSNPNDLEWDVGDWAADGPVTVVAGVPFGTLGRRFRLNLAAQVAADLTLTAFDLDCLLLPDREYDR